MNDYDFEELLKKSKNPEFIYNLELLEVEKELKDQDNYTKKDLDLHNSNYESRLDYSIENSNILLDVGSENITWKQLLWDGKTKYYMPNYNFEDKKNFSLYDVYLTIEKTTGNFTQKDLLNFIDFRISLRIEGNDQIDKDFYTMCLFELLDNQDILVHPNLLYLKAFTFENMEYGIPNYFFKKSGFTVVAYLPNNSYEKQFSQYKITIIYSGKNLSSVNIKPEHLKSMSFNQPIITNIDYSDYDFNNYVKSKYHKYKENGINIVNLMYKTVLFFICDNPLDKDLWNLNDEITNSYFNYLKLKLSNGKNYIYEYDQIIKVNLFGITLCILCIDPELNDINKFKLFGKNIFDYPKTLYLKKEQIKISLIIDCEFNDNSILYLSGLNYYNLAIKDGIANIEY